MADRNMADRKTKTKMKTKPGHEDEVNDGGQGKEKRSEEERLVRDLGRALPRGVVCGRVDL